MHTIVVIEADGTTTTYTTNSKKEAYAIYDRAIDSGRAVQSFTDKRGYDWRDREQDAQSNQAGA